jgi:hypothetical protein
MRVVHNAAWIKWSSNGWCRAPLSVLAKWHVRLKSSAMLSFIVPSLIHVPRSGPMATLAVVARRAKQLKVGYVIDPALSERDDMIEVLCELRREQAGPAVHN